MCVAEPWGLFCLADSQSVDECGDRLRRILESPSVPRANHQLLVHLSRHLARVSQRSQAGPRLLGQAFAESVFRQSPLRCAGSQPKLVCSVTQTGNQFAIQTFISDIINMANRISTVLAS